MKTGLPPLRALRAFEAVVRCGSVTAAAEDLGVTHGAVSKQVAQLEDWYGARLFRRTAAGIRPSPETLAFAREVGDAFDRLRRASESFAGSTSGEQELRILAPATFAMQWLVPRLSSFRNPRNDAPVRVQTSQTTENWQKFSFDVAMRRNFEPTTGYWAVPFLEETLTLMAPPAMGHDLRERGLKSLSDFTLLSSDTRSQELERWLEAAGLPSSGRHRQQRFGHFYVLLQAMLNGFGPAVAPLPVLAGEIMAGRLVIPFPEVSISGVIYSAVVPEVNRGRTDVEAFVRWIEQEREDSERALGVYCREQQLAFGKTTPCA